MIRWPLICCLLMLPPAAVRGVADEPNQAQAETQAETFFQQRIEPLLVSHCLECHGDAASGGLDLRLRQRALAGGDSGAAIVPGQPEQSLLYQYVEAGDMPPKHPLEEAQIAAIETWIRDGAAFPDRPLDLFSITTEHRAGYDWWSLQPLQTAAPPDPSGLPAAWREHPIDRFVFARLEAAGLQPSPPADPVTLIRRATYDLLGLPPAPEQVNDFVHACRRETGRPDQVGTQAYEALVDRLLASPNYGQQWGRHWLDVVRFGESNGFERNIIHTSVWPFRDYVIESFNADKPFDQMIVEHLAGDSLGADDPEFAVGTAFLVCGPYDNVGNQDADAAAQIRADTIDEMIRATSEAFLGMTVGCSRCHDHKFDPISQQDYYSLYATFAGVRHGERRLRRKTPEPASAAADAAAETLRLPVNAQQNVEKFAPVDARFIRLTITATNSGEPCLDELEVFAVAPDQDSAAINVAAASAGAIATSSGDYSGNPKHRRVHINDGRYGNDYSWISDRSSGWIQIELPEVQRIDRIEWGRDRRGEFADRLATEYRIEVAVRPGQWQTVASSDDRQPYQEDSGGDSEGLKWWVGNFSAAPGPFQVFIGGSPQRPGAEVVPASPSMLADLPESYRLPAEAPEQQRRVALARWLVADTNPLTPRVLANRLWHYHFGTGIVSTPSDFGFLGGRPSHPQLLDFLAGELRAANWRLKPLHRQIMLSQTYRQASEARAEAVAIDGDSRLLWRFPPRRLTGEEIRDAMLAVAGELDLTMGGPGFRLFRYVQDNVATYHPLDQPGPETYRRAVYHHHARAMQIDLLSEFDLPDCAFAAPRRTTTTTPLQALTAMNHRFTVDMSQALAARIGRETGGVEAQIERAFHLAYSRSPAAEEVAASKRLIERHGRDAFCRAVLNSNEFIYVD